eukprot:g5317.t1 g5317   contig2:249184-250035(+)
MPVAGDVHNPSPPGQKSPPESNNLEMAANMLKNDLTPLQQTLVDGAIHGSGPLSEVLASSGSDNVLRGSMQRLKPKVWLNDEVVNYFVNFCLASRDKNMHNDNANHRRSHFFNSFFVQTLFNEKNGNANEKGKYKYPNVKRWHKHAPGKNIFEQERIFFPISINNSHWALVVAFMDEKRIQYYDSLKWNGTKYLKGILQYLQDDYKRQFRSDMDTSEWRLVLCTEDAPQQQAYNKKMYGTVGCLFAYLLTSLQWIVIQFSIMMRPQLTSAGSELHFQSWMVVL